MGLVDRRPHSYRDDKLVDLRGSLVAFEFCRGPKLDLIEEEPPFLRVATHAY